MKLNKFLAVAVAATVLPLSVAHAEGPSKASEDAHADAWEAAAKAAANANPTWNTPTAKEGKDAEDKYADAAEAEYKKLTVTTSKGEALVQPELPEFKGGVNGAEPAVLDKPEFKLPAGTSSDDTFGPRKGQAPAKAQNGHKTLPKTSAVK